MVLIYFPFEHFCLFQAMGTFCLHQSIREIYDGECELKVLYIKPKICCVIIINETLVMKQIICTFRMPHEVIFFSDITHIFLSVLFYQWMIASSTAKLLQLQMDFFFWITVRITSAGVQPWYILPAQGLCPVKVLFQGWILLFWITFTSCS